MADAIPTPRRRSVLRTAAGLAVASAALAIAPAVRAASIPAGKPGEFDFLSGEWRIAHRRLKALDDWDVFEGEATCWSLLGGTAHIEELRIPARDFSGMGVRLLDAERGHWADFWVNGKSRVLTPPPTYGGFVNGDGVFESEDVDAGKPIVVRGLWDRIVKGQSHRWSQAVSPDGGRTWETNWLMEWRRT